MRTTLGLFASAFLVAQLARCSARPGWDVPL